MDDLTDYRETPEMLARAEEFVRRVLSHFPDGRADDELVRSAARKVARSLPRQRGPNG
jgi:hypothetical protein